MLGGLGGAPSASGLQHAPCHSIALRKGTSAALHTHLRQAMRLPCPSIKPLISTGSHQSLTQLCQATPLQSTAPLTNSQPKPPRHLKASSLTASSKPHATRLRSVRPSQGRAQSSPFHALSPSTSTQPHATALTAISRPEAARQSLGRIQAAPTRAAVAPLAAVRRSLGPIHAIHGEPARAAPAPLAAVRVSPGRVQSSHSVDLLPTAPCDHPQDTPISIEVVRSPLQLGGLQGLLDIASILGAAFWDDTGGELLDGGPRAAGRETGVGQLQMRFYGLQLAAQLLFMHVWWWDSTVSVLATVESPRKQSDASSSTPLPLGSGQGRRLVGTAVLQLKISGKELHEAVACGMGQPIIILSNVAVAPAWQGLGVGRRIMQAVDSLALGCRGTPITPRSTTPTDITQPSFQAPQDQHTILQESPERSPEAAALASQVQGPGHATPGPVPAAAGVQGHGDASHAQPPVAAGAQGRGDTGFDQPPLAAGAQGLGGATPEWTLGSAGVQGTGHVTLEGGTTLATPHTAGVQGPGDATPDWTPGAAGVQSLGNMTPERGAPDAAGAQGPASMTPEQGTLGAAGAQGYASMTPELGTPAREVSVVDRSVSPSSGGGGGGVVERWGAWWQTQPAVCMILVVYKRNSRAISLYRSCGWREATAWMDRMWEAEAVRGKVGRPRRLLYVRPLQEAPADMQQQLL